MTDYEALNPGVRDLVWELNRRGYETTDSGDGTNHANGMEGALPYRHVYGVVPGAADMKLFADRLQSMYPKATIEVSYNPRGGALFMIMPDGYGVVEGASPVEPVSG